MVHKAPMSNKIRHDEYTSGFPDRFEPFEKLEEPLKRCFPKSDRWWRNGTILNSMSATWTEPSERQRVVAMASVVLKPEKA